MTSRGQHDQLLPDLPSMNSFFSNWVRLAMLRDGILPYDWSYMAPKIAKRDLLSGVECSYYWSGIFPVSIQYLFGIGLVLVQYWSSISLVSVIYQYSISLVWSSSVQFSLVWSGLVRFGPVWSGLVWFGQVWSGLVRFGPVWSGIVRTWGQVRLFTTVQAR